MQILRVSLKAALSVLDAGDSGGEVQLCACVTVTSASQGSVLGSCPCFCQRPELKIKDMRLKVKLERAVGVWSTLCVCSSSAA